MNKYILVAFFLTLACGATFARRISPQDKMMSNFAPEAPRAPNPSHHSGHRGRMSKSAKMTRMFAIMSAMPFEYKGKKEVSKILKTKTKSKNKKVSTFEAEWKTDVQDVILWKNENITKVKTIKKSGKMTGETRDSRRMKSKLMAAMKAKKRAQLKPKTNQKAKKASDAQNV